MALKNPTSAFASVTLDLRTVPVGQSYGRIHRNNFPDPLSFGKNPTRFSDPRRRVAANRFGVFYVGSSLKVCFVETLIRDERDGVVGTIDIAESELGDRYYSTLAAARPLTLLDLTGDGPVRMGIPSDVVRGSRQGLARRWSVAIYDHPAMVDGLLYPSRLNTELNIAVYDRAAEKFAVLTTTVLSRALGIDSILDDFQVALI